MNRLSTLMAVKESYEKTLDIMKESALGVAKLSGDDYQKGFEDGADFIKNIVLGSLDKMIEAVEE
ncbi:hypothetical protein SAG0136_08010 [Streptococcus agalactiae LMG 14747]|uniref:Uncharacterized protein n=1 Tax=Streptococcus agalactiae LMG 14747 TaxID=1154860 RepID=V6Z2I5_STRAG|nr:hypothetical protein SAG0136_08010 [Streptococcus agalactiae LMG 14747]